MRLFYTLVIAAGFIFTTSLSWGGDNGIITEMSGNVKIVSDHRSIEVIYAGMPFYFEDEIHVGNESFVIFVVYQNTQEWSVHGPCQVKIRKGRVEIINGAPDAVKFLRKLPDFYKTEKDNNCIESYSPGGIILRNERAGLDPLEPMRREFNEGKSNNTSLIALIIHDLKHNNPHKAYPYFVELKRRMPDSPFIREIENQFEKQ